MADFLGVVLDNVRCIKSFVILYCSRQTERTTRGGGRVTIFLALGDLSLSNRLPTIGDTSPILNSSDAVMARSEETQMLGESAGGGIALVSDWIWLSNIYLDLAFRHSQLSSNREAKRSRNQCQ